MCGEVVCLSPTTIQISHTMTPLNWCTHGSHMAALDLSFTHMSSQDRQHGSKLSVRSWVCLICLLWILENLVSLSGHEVIILCLLDHPVKQLLKR